MIELTPYLAGIFAAYSILLLGSFSPGPSVAMLIGVATGQGRIPALTAALGIAFGSMSINILTMLGVGIVLSEAAWAMSILRVIGAGYLLYLAYGAIKKAIIPADLQGVDTKLRTLPRQFMAGYLLQVTNPKAISFWLAISSIGAVEGANVGVTILFITGAFFISFVCHGAWAVALSVSAIRLIYIAVQRWIDAALGSFFCFAAYKLAVSDS